MSRIPLFVIVAVLCCGLSRPAWAEVSASLDRDQIGNGETVQLTLTKDSRGGGDPDLSALESDFDVLSTSSATGMQIVNGRVTSSRRLELTLAPRRGGTLQIPPIEWDGESSQALTLVVGGRASSAGGTAANQHLFMRSSLDPEQPYVQQSTVLTVRLYTDQPLYQASLAPPSGEGILVESYGQDVKTQTTLNGRRYDVVQRQYLLTPQRSGKLTLSGAILDAQMPGRSSGLFGGMVTQTQPIRLRAEALELDVRPRPPEWTGSVWLPAQSLTLTEEWQPDDDRIRAGEPITRTLKLTAVGATGAQLPDLSAALSLPEGVKAYPDQSELHTAEQDGQPVGSRVQNIALIADRAGSIELPALTVSWWDTRTQRQREATLPARSLTVLPGAGASQAAAAAAAEPQAAAPVAAGAADTAPQPLATDLPPLQTVRFWRWLSLALGLAWLATSAAWAYTRLRKGTTAVATPPAREHSHDRSGVKAARQAFQQACRDSQPREARKHLLAWAQANDPAHPPAGLQALAERLADARLAGLLMELDRACYSDRPWTGETLAEALKKLPTASDTPPQRRALASLYP